VWFLKELVSGGQTTLFEPSRLALQAAQIVQLSAANLARADELDVIYHRCMDWENAFHAMPEADLTNGDGGRNAGVVFRN
jgi:hypothetical protein